MTRLVVLWGLVLGLACCGPANPKEESLQKGPGSFAGEYLRSSPYTSIRVEWDHAPSVMPTAADRAALEDLQRRVLGKPGGIQSDPPEILSEATAQVYDLAAIRRLEETHRSRYKDPNTGEAVIYVLLLNGSYAMDTADEKVLGIAYRASSLVIFADTITKTCQTGVPGPGALLCNLSRSTTLLHEVGHLLGLVNGGTPMQKPHQDAAHGAHDNNTECLMYYANDSSKMVDRLRQRILSGNQESYPFDQNCLDDLAAFAKSPQ